MKKTVLFTILFAVVFYSAAFSQGTSPVLQNIVSNLKNYSNNHVIEKAYVGFDRPYYSVGDTMYFKAYLVIGERHVVSEASGVLHVDLIDPSNNIIANRILKVANGTAAGDFSLPDTLKAGLYRVRAYTRYMQNEPDYFFDKAIMISGNGNNTADVAAQAVSPDILFFPDGGELISTLIS